MDFSTPNPGLHIELPMGPKTPYPTPLLSPVTPSADDSSNVASNPKDLDLSHHHHHSKRAQQEQPSPLTPPYTPSTSDSLLSAIHQTLLTNPFANLACMYCCPSKACPGGPAARCFKAPLFTAEADPLPTATVAFRDACAADAALLAEVAASYAAYLAKLERHAPYSPPTMAHERRAAAEATRQLGLVAARVAQLRALAEMLAGEGCEAVAPEMADEMAVCRGWGDFLWGKMVRNHECLKLNFGLTFTGVY